MPVAENAVPDEVRAAGPSRRRPRESMVLALGESTGHAHAVVATRDKGDFSPAPAQSEPAFVFLPLGGKVVHEEHGTIPPEGSASVASYENQPDFALLLIDGAQRIHDSTRLTIDRQHGPDLTLPTGRLAVSGFGYGEPFVEVVPPGTYSTEVFIETIALLEDDGITESCDYYEFGALQITIVDAPVTSWEPAMVDRPTRAGAETNAFFVDGGIGVACDASLAETFRTTDDVMAPLEETECPFVLAGVVDVATGASALCMLYGGDGVHESWIGRTADGSIACFVVV